MLLNSNSQRVQYFRRTGWQAFLQSLAHVGDEVNHTATVSKLIVIPWRGGREGGGREGGRRGRGR